VGLLKRLGVWPALEANSCAVTRMEVFSGASKSVNITYLEPLFKIKKLNFLNLKYGDVSDELLEAEKKFGIKIDSIENLDLFNDIEKLISTIDLCDIVVTVSNVTAHLAGSIGEKAAVLVPYGRGKIWYWHHRSGSSLWYPQLKIFHQETATTWTEEIGKACQWIEAEL